jgi:hypothetical protein
MKLAIDWVLARRYRLILLATVLAPLFQVLSAALIALETAERGIARGASAAVIGGLGVFALAFATHSNLALIGGFGAASLAAGLVLGGILRSGRGLRLAFQSTILLSVLAVLGVSLIGPGPAALFAPILDRLANVLKGNGATAEQLQAFHAAEPVVLGLFAAAALTELLAALFLTYWWLGLAANNRRFGLEFRNLKLGLVLGVPATILVMVGLVLDAPLVQNLRPLALFGFLFQGLSVLHAWAYAKRWHPGLLVPVYVLLVSPLVAIVIIGLSGVGLLDNWFDLRAPLRR